MPAKMSLLLLFLLLLLSSGCNKTPSESGPTPSPEKSTNKKDSAEKKLDPVQTREDKVLGDLKQILVDAKTSYEKFESAEKVGNEANRKKYIVLAHKKYIAVIKIIDTLRRPPYADEDELWLPGYEQFEQLEGEAGQALHDILKRSHPGDKFSD